MDNFNKVVSFVLGLVVIVVFLAIITGRFRLGNTLTNLTKRNVTVTPSPTKTSSIKTQIPAKVVSKGQGKSPIIYNQYQAPSSIPSTGAPTILVPLLIGGLFAGRFLQKQR